MKRHKALESLSHEHHHGLMLAQLAKSGSPEYKGLPKTIADKTQYALKFFEENLIPHFKKEEELLFPISRGKNSEIEKLIDELTQQHKKIYLLIDKLKSSSRPENELNELAILRHAHIRKEERELFRLIEQHLSEDEFKKLKNELDDSSIGCKM